MEAYFETRGYRKRVVDGVYILEENGIPIYGRIYSSNVNFDPIMFSGLVSALRSFSIASMQREIIDIGLRGERIFFKQSGKIIYLIIIKAPLNEKRFFVPYELSLTISEILERISKVHELIMETSENDFSESDHELFLATLGFAIDQVVDEVFLGAKTIDTYLEMLDQKAFEKDYTYPKDHHMDFNQLSST